MKPPRPPRAATIERRKPAGARDQLFSYSCCKTPKQGWNVSVRFHFPHAGTPSQLTVEKCRNERPPLRRARTSARLCKALLATCESGVEDDLVTPYASHRFTDQQETHMNIGDSKIQRRASILLALGFILANTGNALASEFDAARGRGEAPDSRNRHGHYHPPRGGWVHTFP